MHIIAHFFPIFWKFPEAVMLKKHKGGQEEVDVVEVDEMVEVDEKR